MISGGSPSSSFVSGAYECLLRLDVSSASCGRELHLAALKMNDTADGARDHRAGLVVLGAMALALVLLRRRSPLGSAPGAFTQPNPPPIPPLQPDTSGATGYGLFTGLAYAPNPGGVPGTSSFASAGAVYASSPGGFPLVSTSAPVAASAPAIAYAASPGGYPLAQTTAPPASGPYAISPTGQVTIASTGTAVQGPAGVAPTYTGPAYNISPTGQVTIASTGTAVQGPAGVAPTAPPAGSRPGIKS
jgi:hypothetical protein